MPRWDVYCAVATYSHEEAGRRSGAAPCDQCGCWTHSWCETRMCHPTSRLNLRNCRQLVYSEAPELSDDECVEFSGVNLENGFHRLDPPVRIKVEEMPLGTDGTYDIDSLLRNVGRHPDDVPGNV